MKKVVGLLFSSAIILAFTGCDFNTKTIKDKKEILSKEISKEINKIEDKTREVTKKIENKVETIKKKIKNKSFFVDDNSTILVNINGKPVLNETTFNKHLQQMLQVNPYLRGASIETIPVQIKRKFLDELVKQELILAWSNEHNIDKDPNFIKTYNEMKNLVRRSLLVQTFERKILDQIKVSDADIENYYNENKDKFLKDAGGVVTQGVFFVDEDSANKFLEEVKSNPSEFKNKAEELYKNAFKDFGKISEKKSPYAVPVPALIKNEVLSLKEIPSVFKVKDGDKIWVVCALNKENPQYYSLDEIKEQLRSMIKQNKFKEKLDEEVKTLESAFQVDINNAFFESKEQKTQPAEQQKKNVKSAKDNTNAVSA